ncbi:hypothetical protein QO021_29730 (plasmid) [Pseudomonas amygdali pv. lachrymans]|uniref:hypothetical protein n=1 Tax=Pseudomonas amygdali TaxID=47877 RepID=UPI000A92147C|nr:hypothetical protein [Pseudomonas amygdali]RMM39325.1 hypothetical protein ALQ79_200261 [Pseudomonas amygdali pv. lachrymans]WIO61270.1 hypothetical protein QO021_29730 [Pseudomonas amygdali pv. lachrymans]
MLGILLRTNLELLTVPPNQVLNSVIKAGWLAFLVWLMLMAAERLYWVNADSYSMLLASPVTISEAMATGPTSYGALCNGEGATLADKSNGHFIRCGYTWGPGSTFRIENYEQFAEWMWRDVE